MLELRTLSLRHPGQPRLLDNISLTVRPGSLLTLLGPNGAGKSTLLDCMAGLRKPQSGAVLLDGRPISSLKARAIARRIAYVAQQPPATYAYTVLDFAVMGRAARKGLFAAPKREDYALAAAALERTGIAHLAGKTYMHASGGEKQLANIARALLQEPALILFDEPTAALDCGNVHNTLKLIKTLVRQGYAVVMTTHHPDHPMLLAQSLPDSRTAVLGRNGRLHEGPTAAVLTDSSLSALYGAGLVLADVPQLGRKVCAVADLD